MKQQNKIQCSLMSKSEKSRLTNHKTIKSTVKLSLVVVVGVVIAFL